MKRGFWFGLGSFFILTVITAQAACSRQPYTTDHRFGAMLATLFFVPASVFLINKAIAAPPNDSIFRGVLGWFIGFFIPYEVMLALDIVSGWRCVNFPACLLRYLNIV
jgi:hypothetical protein